MIEKTQKKRRPTLRELRDRTGLSQEALGHQLGVSFRTIAEWENQRSLPRIDKVVALAGALGVSLEDIAASMGIDVSKVPGGNHEPLERPEEEEPSLVTEDRGLPSVLRVAVMAKKLKVSLKALFEAFDIDTTGIPDDSPRIEPESGEPRNN